jgi:acyl-CoA synthetase (AMP-forming)/AMP-acid ligase II
MSWKLREDPSGLSIRWSDDAARRYRDLGYWRPTTLVDVAREAARKEPGRTLLIEGDVRMTRAQVWEQALRLSGFFLARGLVPGDVISFQLPNWVETAVIALAARMCGLIINPIPPIYREAELSYILRDCRSRMIFVPEVFRKHDHRSTIDKLRTSLPELLDAVTVRGRDAQAPGPGLRWEQVLGTPAAKEGELPRVDPAAVMIVMYTSGTTGAPKGVLHSHYTYDYRVRAMGEAWEVGSGDIVFMPSPVTHITGAYWLLDMPWVRGCVSVMIDVWSADAAIDCIERTRCTISGGATPFLQQLLEIGQTRPGALDSLRLFFCGGTTVSPDLIRTAAREFSHCLFFRAYGSTEMPTTTTGIRSRAQAAMGVETDGEVVAPTEVAIVDPAGDAPVPDGTEGEIVARGPEQFVGYLHPEDNAKNFDDQGFFRMGDLGRRVHRNYLVITGRKKDIVIRSGENISPKEVEDVLLRHPGVADVAIVAMPSTTTGEKGCAFIIPRAGATVDLAELRRFLDAAGLARQKFPEHLVLVEDLPRVPSGKVRKDVLRQQARAIAETQVRCPTQAPELAAVPGRPKPGT